MSNCYARIVNDTSSPVGYILNKVNDNSVIQANTASNINVQPGVNYIVFKNQINILSERNNAKILQNTTFLKITGCGQSYILRDI